MAKHVLVELIGEDRRLSERILSEIVGHFVLCKGSASGHGLFDDDALAIALAQEMGKMPIRKFKRYGTVPVKFYEWLRKTMILSPDFALSCGKSTISGLLLNLENASSCQRLVNYFLERDQERDQLRMRKEYSELKKSFGTQQGTWIAIDNMRQRKHVRPPR